MLDEQIAEKHRREALKVGPPTGSGQVRHRRSWPGAVYANCRRLIVVDISIPPGDRRGFTIQRGVFYHQLHYTPSAGFSRLWFLAGSPCLSHTPFLDPPVSASGTG